jgi:hypothetical protein
MERDGVAEAAVPSALGFEKPGGAKPTALARPNTTVASDEMAQSTGTG